MSWTYELLATAGAYDLLHMSLEETATALGKLFHVCEGLEDICAMDEEMTKEEILEDIKKALNTIVFSESVDIEEVVYERKLPFSALSGIKAYRILLVALFEKVRERSMTLKTQTQKKRLVTYTLNIIKNTLVNQP